MASDTFPPGKGRGKVMLEPGFGLSDWMTMQRQMIPVGTSMMSAVLIAAPTVYWGCRC
jgi:hypothetical protein